MKRVRLPKDGQIIDTDVITAVYWKSSGKGDYLVVRQSASEAMSFEGPDARALYAWLEANSTAIGENGREVKTKYRINIDLSPAQMALLEWLNANGAIATNRIADISPALSSLEFLALVQNNLIIKDDNDTLSVVNWYVITDLGRAAIEDN